MECLDRPLVAPDLELQQDQDIDLLTSWLNYCELQADCHDKNTVACKTLNFLIYMPAILLSVVAGTANIGVGSTSQQNCTESGKNWMTIGFGAMGLLSGALFSLQRSLQLPELQTIHKFYADEYTKLAMEIRMQIVLDATTRYQAYKTMGEFIKHCKRSLDVLIDRAPLVDERIKNKALKRQKEKAPSPSPSPK
jgi:hypothetical protein